MPVGSTTLWTADPGPSDPLQVTTEQQVCSAAARRPAPAPDFRHPRAVTETSSPLRLPLFDAHLHVIDPRFPLIPDNGYLPPVFTVSDYRSRTRDLAVVGGAVVSGSFQGFDQTYLLAALAELGPGFVGVTQLPVTTPDRQVLALSAAGVGAVRFNIRRGGSETLGQLDRLARRVHELAGWHSELYVDAADLPDIAGTVAALPRVSVDHLGLSREGLRHLLRLAERGVHVKATGFGRGDLDVPDALRQLAHANPGALMVGTDLPSTRAPRAFADSDLDLVVEALHDDDLIAAAFTGNALALYRPPGGS